MLPSTNENFVLCSQAKSEEPLLEMLLKRVTNTKAFAQHFQVILLRILRSITSLRKLLLCELRRHSQRLFALL
jgi:hypothetical protein